MIGRRTFLSGIAAGLAFAPTASLAQAAFSTRAIIPANPLEEAFTAAFGNEAMRPVFRARFLDSQVSLALASAAENAEPLRVQMGQVQRGVIYTSPSRLTSVLGANAPHAQMTGREALTRLNGGNVAINYRLVPMLTLDAEDVANFLAIPG